MALTAASVVVEQVSPVLSSRPSLLSSVHSLFALEVETPSEEGDAVELGQELPVGLQVSVPSPPQEVKKTNVATRSVKNILGVNSVFIFPLVNFMIECFTAQQIIIICGIK